MKRLPRFFGVILTVGISSAVILATPAEVSRIEESAPSDGDVLVPLAPRRIKLNMTHAEVISSMHGRAHHLVSGDIWIYWDFKGTKRPPSLEEPALIVFFKGGKVSEIRFAESNLVRKILAHHQAITKGGTKKIPLP